MLLEIRRDGKRSLRDMAEALGWSKDGAPHKDRVRWATDKLKRSKLVTYVRSTWKLTAQGENAAVDAANDRHRADAVAGFVSRQTVRYGDSE